MNKFDIVEDIIATNIEYYDPERALTWYEIFLPDRRVTFDKTHSTYIGYFTNFKLGEEVILFVNNDLEKTKILHVFYKNNKMTD